MENIDGVKNSSSEFQSGKLKWILVTVGLVLIISIVLKLILAFDVGKTQPTKITDQQATSSQEQTAIEQLPINDDDILEETHKIDKAVDKNGITWLGIKATPDKGQVAVNYELWHVDEKNEKLLIENFPLSICDDISWGLNEKSGVDLLYMTSPCEAFVVNTNIIYNEQGVEQFRMVHNSSAGNFTFKHNGKRKYQVSLIVDGACEGSIPQSPAEPSVPKVLLKGVKLTTSRDENEFTLAKPAKISCGTGYGDTIIDPTISKPILGEEKIEFTLPNDQKAIISLKATSYAEVEFK
ncbi:MAG: hypothetical protein Q7S48_01410 [bacterium]|nr:hypothetical protein [bacterium]